VNRRDITLRTHDHIRSVSSREGKAVACVDRPHPYRLDPATKWHGPQTHFWHRSRDLIVYVWHPLEYTL
jgi:hypothetical protein